MERATHVNYVYILLEQLHNLVDLIVQRHVNNCRVFSLVFFPCVEERNSVALLEVQILLVLAELLILLRLLNTNELLFRQQLDSENIQVLVKVILFADAWEDRNQMDDCSVSSDVKRIIESLMKSNARRLPQDLSAEIGNKELVALVPDLGLVVQPIYRLAFFALLDAHDVDVGIVSVE